MILNKIKIGEIFGMNTLGSREIGETHSLKVDASETPFRLPSIVQAGGRAHQEFFSFLLRYL
ncbi:hypothetical protein JCM31447_05240 [Fluviispira sanaruensis]|uniref:Uncharacterized protein n=1 Tax=Fluviispira sanaruensis TaxID=2493639 RepID=A0A4V0P259_FLUSA|nr:hypothetical protein JCM31447_05240 [Fluviispira sanaruensis]